MGLTFFTIDPYMNIIISSPNYQRDGSPSGDAMCQVINCRVEKTKMVPTMTSEGMVCGSGKVSSRQDGRQAGWQEDW